MGRRKVGGGGERLGWFWSRLWPWLLPQLCSSMLHLARMAGFDGSAWDEEEEEPAPDHQYYNDFPGKEPPIGGVVDMRLRDGAAQTPNHLGATLVRLWALPPPGRLCDAGEMEGPGQEQCHGRCVPGTWSRQGWSTVGFTTLLCPQPVGQPSGGDYESRKQHSAPQGNPHGHGQSLPAAFLGLPSAPAAGTGQVGALLTHLLLAAGREKCPAPAGTAGRTDLFDDPSYVNVQNMDKARLASAAGTPATANGSTQRDLFDMSE